MLKQEYEGEWNYTKQNKTELYTAHVAFNKAPGDRMQSCRRALNKAMNEESL